jgi:hypothetical protein
MRIETEREAAYRTLTEPVTVQDAAREMGTTESVVRQQIKGGHLLALSNGRITGSELARFFAAHRRG